MLREELTPEMRSNLNILSNVDISISNLVDEILYYSPDEEVFEDKLRNAQEDLNRVITSIFS